jgi:hypothetical protein
MNKRILILAMTVFTLVVMTLPMIPTAQACRCRRPTEVYDDLFVWGGTVPDGPADVWSLWGNKQCGRFTAHSSFVQILWDRNPDLPTPPKYNGILEGEGEYIVCYTINKDTGKGIATLKTKVTIDDDVYGAGTFEGYILWVGDLILNPDNTVRLPNLNMGEMGSWAWYTYWRGTLAYAGWTITQNFDETWNTPGGNYEGYLTIR